jgi:hypothetical protein
MSATITIQLPEDVLLDALRQLPPSRRRRLLQQLADEPSPTVVSIPAAELDQWTGLISIGGDALAESEQLYDE